MRLVRQQSQKYLSLLASGFSQNVHCALLIHLKAVGVLEDIVPSIFFYVAGFMAHESGQAILAGDPHQLGPVVPSDIASSYGLAQSLLSRLLPKFPYQRDAVGFPESGGYDPRLVTRLSVNYRSLPDILELPSSLFYDSDLEPSVYCPFYL